MNTTDEYYRSKYAMKIDITLTESCEYFIKIHWKVSQANESRGRDEEQESHDGI